MNILVVGKFYKEAFALHIVENLKKIGHTVYQFDPGYKAGRLDGVIGHRVDQVLKNLYTITDNLPKIRMSRTKNLWEKLESNSIDLIIVCYDFLQPNEVAELKKCTHAKIVLWFPDAIVNFGRAYFMNADYDAIFFKDPFILHALDKVLKSPIYYLPECFNPHKHSIDSEVDLDDPFFNCDITTAGNFHSWRVACYKHLPGYKVKLWGNPAPLWMSAGIVNEMYQGVYVGDSDKAKAFLSAKIVVNNLHFGEIWGVNARCFEAAGIGAFQMLDWRPGLSQLFEDGKELITFRGIDDLKMKIKFWLPRDSERHEIGNSAKKRAYSEHTYRHRLELLLDTVSGRENGFPTPDIKIICN